MANELTEKELQLLADAADIEKNQSKLNQLKEQFAQAKAGSSKPVDYIPFQKMAMTRLKFLDTLEAVIKFTNTDKMSVKGIDSGRLPEILTVYREGLERLIKDLGEHIEYDSHHATRCFKRLEEAFQALATDWLVESKDAINAMLLGYSKKEEKHPLVEPKKDEKTEDDQKYSSSNNISSPVKPPRKVSQDSLIQDKKKDEPLENSIQSLDDLLKVCEQSKASLQEDVGRVSANPKPYAAANKYLDDFIAVVKQAKNEKNTNAISQSITKGWDACKTGLVKLQSSYKEEKGFWNKLGHIINAIGASIKTLFTKGNFSGYKSYFDERRAIAQNIEGAQNKLEETVNKKMDPKK